MTTLPTVLYKDYNANFPTDIISCLLKDRIIMLYGEINDILANLIIAQILYLEAENHDASIYIYINSPGGGVTAALSIYDVMKYVAPKIITVCIGEACSCASLLFCAGDERLIMPNARILLHQPTGGIQGQAADINLYVKEILEIQNILLDLYHQNTNIERDKLKNYFDRDTVFRPAEAVNVGLADKIIASRATTEKRGSYTSKNKDNKNNAENENKIKNTKKQKVQ